MMYPQPNEMTNLFRQILVEDRARRHSARVPFNSGALSTLVEIPRQSTVKNLTK